MYYYTYVKFDKKLSGWRLEHGLPSTRPAGTLRQSKPFTKKNYYLVGDSNTVSLVPDQRVLGDKLNSLLKN